MSDHRTPTAEASTGELITQASHDIATLIRSEMQLAKQDLAQSGKKLGIGAGLFGLAGTLALYGLGALVAAAVLGIAEGLEPWIAAVIVGAALFLAAGIAALVGKGSVSHVAEAPQQRAESVKADLAAARTGSDGGTR